LTWSVVTLAGSASWTLSSRSGQMPWSVTPRQVSGGDTGAGAGAGTGAAAAGTSCRSGAGVVCLAPVSASVLVPQLVKIIDHADKAASSYTNPERIAGGGVIPPIKPCRSWGLVSNARDNETIRRLQRNPIPLRDRALGGSL